MSKRILAVDDEAVVLGAVTKALSKTDCTVDTASSAAEALEKTSSGDYDVIITDLMMPGMDGLQFLQRLREHQISARIIMLTGYPTIQTALKAKRLGAFEYVTKPFTRQELVSVVVRAFRTGQAGTAPGEESVGGDPPGTYFIPGHAWVGLDNDGTARIGMARPFAAEIGKVVGIDFPDPGSTLEQGRACLVLHSADQIPHFLNSPLSGRVIEVNPAARMDPELASQDPEGRGWLLRLAPEKAERELANLAPR